MEYGVRSQKLAAFAVDTKFEDIPTTVIEKTKRHILDTLGAGLAGALSDEVSKLAKVFELYESSGTVPLWGTGRKAGARNAALANGMACHTFELDDTGGCDHSGAVVIPALLAALPICSKTVTGKDFISAVVVGYDIARRALESCGAYEPHNEQGWHSTSTCGTFGAAAAVGRLMALEIPEMQSAIGLAASMSGGTWAFIHDGAQSKRLHPGRAAEGGLLSAMLAKNGFKGPSQIFDDVWGGFSRTYSPNTSFPQAWVEELGQNWKMNRVSIKPHASCRSAHSGIDAVNFIMKKNNLSPDSIKTITIRWNTFLNNMCGGKKTETLPMAQMSLPYALCALLRYGTTSLEAYTKKRRLDTQIIQDFSKIITVCDDTMPADEEPFITIETVTGEHYTHQVPIPLGAPANPLSDEKLIEKYESLAGMIWPEETVKKLCHEIMSLEACSNIEKIDMLLGTSPLTQEKFI